MAEREPVAGPAQRERLWEDVNVRRALSLGGRQGTGIATLSDDGSRDERPFSLDFFEVVLVRPGAADNLLATPGAVLGRTRDDDGAELYAVQLDGSATTSMVALSDLEPTGERRRREDLYDGARIRVSRLGEPL